MSEDMSDCVTNTSDDTYLKSMFYEQLVEHVFVSEVLQEVWFSFRKTVEVLRSEVDVSGYDLVFDCDGVVRHVQLKTSKHDAKASGQKVNVALAKKPSGCVIWIMRREEQGRMIFDYKFFGGKAKTPLPSLDGFKVAKHSKGNALGIKMERKAIRVVPRGEFTEMSGIRELVKTLFGL
jgi:hypothetical protein